MLERFFERFVTDSFPLFARKSLKYREIKWVDEAGVAITEGEAWGGDNVLEGEVVEEAGGIVIIVVLIILKVMVRNQSCVKKCNYWFCKCCQVW